jgi:RNA polymerase sigma factor (sigma-70 family)
LARGRGSIGGSLLRLRSDEQLVALFRAGHEEAFRVIHDRYRTRLFAYTRQMLPACRQDAEDALQDVFVRAYAGLRASDREIALRAWLYRVAHNRCIDQLRRPAPVVTEAIEEHGGADADPSVAAEQRETLRRLIVDVRRLPEQQRSALLMRELSGMSYAELAEALGLSVPAVKSLLVRARVSLAASLQARETACEEIREEIAACHDRKVRPTATARRHLRDCPGCRDFRRVVRASSHELAALVPAAGPVAVVAKLLGLCGLGGGAAAGSSGAGAGGGAAAGGAAATGVLATSGAVGAGAGLMTTTGGHVAALLAAAIVTAGSAVGIQPVLAPAHHHARAAQAAPRAAQPIAESAATATLASAGAATGASGAAAGAAAPPSRTATRSTAAGNAGAPPAGSGGASSSSHRSAPTAPATAVIGPVTGTPPDGLADPASNTGAIPIGAADGTTSDTSSSSTSPSTGGTSTSSGSGATTTGGSSDGSATTSGTGSGTTGASTTGSGGSTGSGSTASSSGGGTSATSAGSTPIVAPTSTAARRA